MLPLFFSVCVSKFWILWSRQRFEYCVYSKCKTVLCILSLVASAQLTLQNSCIWCRNEHLQTSKQTSKHDSWMVNLLFALVLLICPVLIIGVSPRVVFYSNDSYASDQAKRKKLVLSPSYFSHIWKSWLERYLDWKGAWNEQEINLSIWKRSTRFLIGQLNPILLPCST